jgi:tRNA(His) guanylyltransferase
MKDALGDRMKSYYEDITRTYLPRRTYTIIRVDGKAFHTFTRKFNRPFDEVLIDIMNRTAKYLCENVQGCKMAFVQSDEISLILTDFDDINTSAWFDGNIQKITSVVASMATMAFNKELLLYKTIDILDPIVFNYGLEYEKAKKIDFAMFDARVFTIPTKTEVMNYFVWRQKDATRNSISMVAQSLYSHKELNGKSTDQMQEMIFQKGTNWNDYNDGMKRDRCVVRRLDEIKTGSLATDVVAEGIRNLMYTKEVLETRKKWKVENPPIFTEDWTYLSAIIPENK